MDRAPAPHSDGARVNGIDHARTRHGGAGVKKVKRLAKRVIVLGVTAVSIYLIIPSVVATFSSWPELKKLRSGSLLGMTALVVASYACFTAMIGLCLRTRQWALVATSQLASGTIARVVPGGAATATAVQYRMLRSAGVDRSTAGTGLTVATLLNFAVLFALPVLAVPALLSGASVDSALVSGALIAAICFVAAAVLGALLLFWDRPLRALGRLFDAVQRRRGRLNPDQKSSADRLVDGRDLIRSYLADRWYWVTLASCGKWGFEYLALVLAVHGVGHDDTSSVLILAYVSASLLGRVPFTPGGVGFVEAGLAGMLTLAGLSAGDAATTTLAFRLVTYWLPIPVGGVAYGIYRLRQARRGVDVPTLASEVDEVDGTEWQREPVQGAP